MEKEQFDVYCVNTGKTIRVNGGESLLEIYKLANPRLAHRPICAYVNNKTEELKYRVFGPKDIEFLDISHPAGMRTYVRPSVLSCTKQSTTLSREQDCV